MGATVVLQWLHFDKNMLGCSIFVSPLNDAFDCREVLTYPLGLPCVELRHGLWLSGLIYGTRNGSVPLGVLSTRRARNVVTLRRTSLCVIGLNFDFVFGVLGFLSTVLIIHTYMHQMFGDATTSLQKLPKMRVFVKSNRKTPHGAPRVSMCCFQWE